MIIQLPFFTSHKLMESSPSDILFVITNNLDYKSIISFSEVCIKFHEFYICNSISLLRSCLHVLTKLNIYKYNLQELRYLYQVVSNKDIVDADYNNSLILKRGRVYSCGFDNRIPIQVKNFNNITICQIKTICNFSLVLSNDGEIYMFKNPLVVGTELLCKVHAACQLAINYISIFILTNSHKIYTMSIEEMKLHIIPVSKNIVQISARKYRAYCLSDGGDIYRLVGNELQPMMKDYNIVSISAGSYDIIALTSDGYVYTQLLINSRWDLIENLSNIIAIAAGDANYLALSITGQVYGYGYNENCELGLGDNISVREFVLNPNVNNIICMACNSHSLFMTANKDIYSCGYNEEGQLGLGDNRDRNTPTLMIFNK